jgi:hypothetical protein
MREALDWLVDRLASGWATHAVLLADEGKQHTSLMALAPVWIRPAAAARLLFDKEALPDVQAIGLVCIAHR